MKEDVVQGYESWYTGKYQRADLLEKQVIKLMLSEFDQPKTVLEIGCGTGHFTRWFGESGFQASGLDLSPLMIRQAKKLWPGADLINGASLSLPLISKSFDVALFITCFEYMKDPLKVLREAERVSRQGIVLGLMNAWSLPTLRRKLQLAFGKNDYYRNAHFYSISEIKNLSKKAFNGSAKVTKWRTTLFPKPLGLERDTGNPFGAFLGVAIKTKAGNSS
jgi:ubiquinone/menaquinone biosynthesis C-methylase UbiE